MNTKIHGGLCDITNPLAILGFLLENKKNSSKVFEDLNNIYVPYLFTKKEPMAHWQYLRKLLIPYCDPAIIAWEQQMQARIEEKLLNEPIEGHNSRQASMKVGHL